MTKPWYVGMAAIILKPSLVLGLWVATYPGYYDPKNVHYLFWKWVLRP